MTIKVLDHGFVRIVDLMGSDGSIVDAARVSYGKGTRSSRSSEKLIRYLMKHYHTTPFEQVVMCVHIKCPIFVARQWMRTRCASYNEYSARYSTMSEEFYSPELDRVKPQDSVNKQCSAEETNDVIDGNKEAFVQVKDRINSVAKETYRRFEDLGFARELNRIHLPVSNYTEFYMTINAKNLMDFIRLRIASNAQWEIAEYAAVLKDVLKVWLPFTHDAFEEYHLHSATLSKTQLDHLRGLCPDISVREKKELVKLGLIGEEL